jgi:hypothetical protein
LRLFEIDDDDEGRDSYELFNTKSLPDSACSLNLVSFLWAGILVSSLGLFLHGPIVKERWWFLTLSQKAEFQPAARNFYT